MGNRLDGKVAIVTGAGSGIGQATAVRFANEGASVVIADVNEAGGQETLLEIEQAGGTATFVPTDVAKAEQIARMVAETVSRFGKLDILVNSAATLINTPLI
jgi:NAD(P)-dependent dehydrogenase (short-subunit alcohol dehydrogenase family)